MNRSRLVLITRRFWPLVGGAERAMANLAAGFQTLGHSTTVLTACWQPDWPTEIEHRRVHVVRLPHPPLRMWGTWRYMRSISSWLSAHRNAFDLALVSMLKHDAYATIGVARRAGFPVVLRAAGSGMRGDSYWQQHARFGRWIKQRCQQADAIVAPSPAIQQELLAAGYHHEQLHFIPNGVALPPLREGSARTEARAALATGHPAMGLSATTPLAVYTGPLEESKGLTTLIEAWPLVLHARPHARLWLAGDGPQREELQALIERRKLKNRIMLVGSFDSVDELMIAADVFVLPSREEGMSQSLLEAMAHGLPIVATDIPGNRNLVTHEQEALLVPRDDRVKLSAALVRLLDEPALARQLGAQARQRVQWHFSLDKMISAYLQLFDRLLTPSPAAAYP